MVLLVAGGLTFLAFEGMLRFFLPQRLYRYPRYFFQSDPQRVFSMKPHFSASLSSPEFRTQVRINALGLRGPEVGPKQPGSCGFLL
jgi:hypothetical protein